jgi:translation initiation factor 2B subunit (eIF-2B alpha/beta/delta family)
MLHLGNTNETIAAIRQKHHERSANYIRQNRAALGLEHQEAVLIAEVSRFHRKSLNIMECEEQVGTCRLRLLAAYLRLADALHVDATRSPDAMYQLLVAAGMPWESRIHWLKSFWVYSVIPDPEHLNIQITLLNTGPESSRLEILADMVRNEIREELDSIKDVLIRGNISYFLDIESKVAEIPGNEPLIELDLVLSNLEQENLSSASEVSASIVETIIRLTDIGPDAYKVIREYREQLNKLLSTRSCHVLIRNLLEDIDRATQKGDLDESASIKVIEQIRADLVSFKEMRQRSIMRLAENAKPFLSDGTSILLFGYSSLVISALDFLSAEIKDNIRIFVAEGRGKTQYNHENELTYSDGIRYAIKCKNIGFSDVEIIPDICATNLMMRGLIGKVVLGANGIDPAGDFGHSAGHLAIAVSAKHFGIPVYIIADTAKFGEFPWNQQLEREHYWLTRDQKTLKELQKYNVKTLNPREDRVSRDCVDMVITEVGAFPPARIPPNIRDRH